MIVKELKRSISFFFKQCELTRLVGSSLLADSLEDMSWEAKATPGLQQLARVFTIQR